MYLILSILLSHLSLADYIIRRVIPEERNPRTTPHRPPACPGAEPPSLEILFSSDSVIAFRLPISFLPFFPLTLWDMPCHAIMTIELLMARSPSIKAGGTTWLGTREAIWESVLVMG